jgi:hypothetical protein
VYTGHFGLALAGAGLARRLPLWLLILATFAADIIEGVVAAFYVKDPTRVWSHSLPITLAAGAVLGLAWMLAGGRWREALVLGLVSASHTALDFLTAVKTWWPGQPVAGLDLYKQPLLNGVLEISLCVVGWFLWWRALPLSRRHTVMAWAPLGLLAAAQLVAMAFVEWTEPSIEGLSKFVR